MLFIGHTSSTKLLGEHYESVVKEVKKCEGLDVWPVGLFFIELVDIEALGHVVIYSYFFKTRFEGGSTETHKSNYYLIYGRSPRQQKKTLRDSENV